MSHTFELLNEQHIQNGWQWQVNTYDAETQQTHIYTLAMANMDYERWSHGAIAPYKVARKLLDYTFSHLSQPWPKSMEASILSRRMPELDKWMRNQSSL